MKNNFNVFLKQFSSAVFLVAILVLPFFVFADNDTSTSTASPSSNNSSILTKLKTVGTKGGYADASETSLARSAGMLVNTVLGLLGILFIILIIVGGFQWMTAGGNEDAIKKAQSRIKNAVIGLVIIVSSYAIWNTVDRYFITKINDNQSTNS